MKQVKAPGADISVIIRIVDSTDGTPETGVVAATAGLVLNYRREGAALVNVAGLSDLALLTSAHADGGLLHISDGYYRFDVPDAAFAAGVDGVLVEGTATGMVVIGTYVQLVGYDPRTELTAAVLAVAGAAAAPGAAMNTTMWGGAAVGAMPNSVAPPAMITGQEVRDAMKLAPTALPAPAAGSVDTHLDDLLARMGAFPGTTTNTVYGWLRAMMRKDVAAPTDIGGTFDPATDSGEGLRDTLPTGGLTAQQVRDAMKLAPTVGAPVAGSVDAHLDSIVTTLAALPAAVWAATTRTLTSFGTALAGVAQAVWEYVKRELTQSPEDVAAAVSGTNLTIISAVTYDYTLTGLVIPANWKKLWLTLKTKRTDDDEDSVAQIVESNPGVAADGLLYLNGASGTKAQASLTVNQGAGTIAIHIDDEATAELARWTGGYDVKVLDDAGDTSQIRSAKVSVVLTETKAIA